MCNTIIQCVFINIEYVLCVVMCNINMKIVIMQY